MIYANLTRSFTVEKMVAPSVQLGAIWQTRPLRMVGSFQSYLREKERGESFMLSVQWELGGGVRMVSERLQKSSVSGRVLSSTSLKPLDKADVRCIGDKNEGLSISQTNKDGVFVLQSARLSSCASFEVIYQGITKKFPSSALPESDIAIKFPDRSVVYISFYEDKNSNNALDEDDPQVKLENYIAEIGEGIVQADQGTFVDGTLTVPRKKKVGFTATSQYLPAGFISLQFIPEWVDSYSEDFVDLKVLLKKQ
jgi:hypothetical protein